MQPVFFRARPEGATNVAIAAASSTQSAAITNGIHAVRLVPSINCWVTIGSNPSATVGTGSWFMKAQAAEYLECNPGDKFAVISDDGVSTGTLNVLEMTR